MKDSTYTYDFKNKRVRAAFKAYAAEKQKSIQELITEALKEKHPEFYTKNDASN